VIRRALLLISVLYILIWFLAAHLIKNEAVKGVSRISNDNIRLSYDKVNVSGFPFFWRLRFDDFRIISTDHDGLGEIKLDFIALEHKIYSSEVTLSKRVLFDDLKNVENKFISGAKSEYEPVIRVTYSEPVLFPNKSNIKEYFAELYFSLPSVKYFSPKKILADLKNLEILLTRVKSDNLNTYQLTKSFDFTPKMGIDYIKSAKMLVDVEYVSPRTKIEKSSLGYNYKIQFNKFNFKYDDSQMNLGGVVTLSSGEMPKGQLKFLMRNHEELVDWFSDYLGLSKKFITEYLKYNIRTVNDSNLYHSQLDLIFE